MKIKTVLSAIIILVFISCEKEETIKSDIEILNTNQSECKQLKSESVGEVEFIYIKNIGAQNYSIMHENLMLNCCLDKGISVAITQSADTIILHEWEKKMGLCDCIYPYDVETEFGPVEYGTYVLKVEVGGWNQGSIVLEFNENMDVVIPVSDLEQNRTNA